MTHVGRIGIGIGMAVLATAAPPAPAGEGKAKLYPCRWFYVSRNLRADEHVEDIRKLVRIAAGHGLNGMVLAGLSGLDEGDAGQIRRVGEVRKLCRQAGIEIIPLLCSPGYGGSIIRRDRNLAAGLEVRDALFLAGRHQASLVPDPPVELANGGFERFANGRAVGWAFHDRPGKVTFRDTEVRREGEAALRFECAATDEHGHARVMQKLAVRPRRCYRLSLWVKTDGLVGGPFRVTVLGGDRRLAPVNLGVPDTAGWKRVHMGFNSFDCDAVRIYAGAWKAREGRFWIDGVTVEEVGPMNVLRRPGTPITVRGEKTGRVYSEGRDYAPIVDEKLTFRFDGQAPPLRLLKGGRIADGERLRVSWYHGIAINNSQVTVCMSEPKVYAIWRSQARAVHRHLAPSRVLLSADEIRAGGSCRACRSRKLSMAEILGDCITRQAAIFRELNPDCELLVWSDMLDPHHNAQGNYYLVEGDFTGSWNHVPEDLVIVCWHRGIRQKSLEHFSRLGFRALAGAYYDTPTLANCRQWLDSLDRTPGAVGIMYTTWQNKYDLLGAFGDLVSERAAE